MPGVRDSEWEPRRDKVNGPSSRLWYIKSKSGFKWHSSMMNPFSRQVMIVVFVRQRDIHQQHHKNIIEQVVKGFAMSLILSFEIALECA
jgi:hypothetical protein